MKKIIFLSIVILASLTIQVFTIHDEFFKDYSYLRYCKVIKKVDYVEITKHKSNYSSNPERALIVKWIDNNTIEELEVTPDTFFTTNEGADIVFKRKLPKFTTRHPFIGTGLFMFISIIATGVEDIGLMFLIAYLIGTYIFDKKDMFKD